MYKCDYCSRSYVWKQSLKRHVQQSHWDEASDEYDETNADMSDESSHSQQSDVDDASDNDSVDDSRDESGDKSKSEGSDDDSGDDDKETDSDSDDEDETLWVHVIEDIVRGFKTQHEQKRQHYEAADALELAEEAMYPIYKRALKQRIGKQLVFDFQLRRSGYYNKLERDLKKFTKKHSLLRAVRATFRKNDNILEDMLEDYDEQKTLGKEQDEEMDAIVDKH